MSTDPTPQRFPELDDKTLLVCIGAAKCATSWLHSYLHGLPDAVVSPLKELHFFNAKFPQNAFGDMEAQALTRLRLHLDQQGDAVQNLRQHALFQASVDRAQMVYDESAYFGHFARLCAPQTRVFCDITPAYSVIGKPGFAYLKDFCAAQNVPVKLLFILRDPLTRLWSQLRHMQQMNPANDALTKWRAALRAPPVMARADYRGIVNAVDATFPHEDVLYLFYEDLFSTPALDRLTDFVGVARRPADTSRVENETQVKLDLPADAARCFASALAAQYDFCRQRFGSAVPANWAG